MNSEQRRDQTIIFVERTGEEKEKFRRKLRATAGSNPTAAWTLNYRRTVNRRRNNEDWLPGEFSSGHSRNFSSRIRVYVYVYVYVCTCVKQRSGSGCWRSGQKFDTIVVWWVCRCRQRFSLLRWSVVRWKTRVLATGRTTRGLFHSPSVFRHSLSLVEHEECLPSSSCH